MLKSLYINNYALINELDLEFKSGLNVITGETGAGKSILIGALGLILGNRADKSVVSNNARKCIVEGVFDNISDAIKNLLAEYNFDVEQELHIRREIINTGKSRAFINDTPASLQQLKAFAAQLIDVNSQNQTYIFKEAEHQLAMLDDLAECRADLDKYTNVYKDYKKIKKELDLLLSEEKEAQKQQDFIKFQFEELEEANLQIGEEVEIREQLKLLDNAELIKQALHFSSDKLSQADENIVGNLELILSELTPLQNLHTDYSELYGRLNSSMIELQDIAAEYEQLNDSTEFDPEQHSELQARLDIILHLQQKHRLDSVDELLELQNELDNQLQKFGSLALGIEKLSSKLKSSKAKTEKLAKMLSNKRKKAIPSIENKIVKGLRELGMKDAEFKVIMSELSDLSISGIDIVDFMFSSNKGHKVDSIAKVASGGELSRVVLTLKSLLSANRNLPTVIFDEIDTGVSGDIAAKVGDVMQQMAKDMQLITITHLPQIAAKSDYHYKVFKKDVNDITFSDIKLLDLEQRKQEVALMLSGDVESESALRMAAELMRVKVKG